MRAIDADFSAHLAGEATTVCHCWRVIRRDGTVLGFTEHDHDLAFAATQFLAASGFSASEGEATAGLPASTSDVSGGFSSEVISEADLDAGLYDGARVEVYLVNWAAPDQHVLLKVQEIGEVTRQTGQFQAELRSFAARLSEPQGRIYNRRCDALLGDIRCGIDLSLPQYSAEGIVTAALDATRLTLSGIAGFADGFFSRGMLAFLDGETGGVAVDIDSHSVSDGVTVISLWLPMKTPPAPATGSGYPPAATRPSPPVGQNLPTRSISKASRICQAPTSPIPMWMAPACMMGAPCSHEREHQHPRA